MTAQPVALAIEKRIARLTLQRPAAGNAFTSQMMADFLAAVTRAVAEADILVMAGAGEDFTVGRDREEPKRGAPFDAFRLITDLNAALASAVSTAMTKIEAVIPEALRPVLLEAPLFAPGSEWAQSTARQLSTLRRAIGESRYVHFRYTREDGEETERDVAPLGLYYWGRTWTLAAWCDLRQDYRSFRPDRMQEVALLERNFDREAGPSLSEFLGRVQERPEPRWNTF